MKKYCSMCEPDNLIYLNQSNLEYTMAVGETTDKLAITSDDVYHLMIVDEEKGRIYGSDEIKFCPHCGRTLRPSKYRFLNTFKQKMIECYAKIERTSDIDCRDFDETNIFIDNTILANKYPELTDNMLIKSYPVLNTLLAREEIEPFVLALLLLNGTDEDSNEAIKKIKRTVDPRKKTLLIFRFLETFFKDLIEED